jgi:hypothetical protein
MMERKTIVLACLFSSLFTPTLNAAYVYDLQIFNNPGYENNPYLAFTAEVFDSGGQAVFEFRNNSTMSSVITEIYFDSEGLLELDHITNYIVDEDNKIGTKFESVESGDVHPSNLPAAHLLDPYFEANVDLSAGACNPSPKWGIGPYEKLQMAFNLTGGHNFSDVISALNSGTDLRIGMHIQSVGPEGVSVSAINKIPEPITVCLLSLGGLALLRKRRAGTA